MLRCLFQRVGLLHQRQLAEPDYDRQGPTQPEGRARRANVVIPAIGATDNVRGELVRQLAAIELRASTFESPILRAPIFEVRKSKFEIRLSRMCEPAASTETVWHRQSFAPREWSLRRRRAPA